MMAALSFQHGNNVKNAFKEPLDSEFHSQNEYILTPPTNYLNDILIECID